MREDRHGEILDLAPDARDLVAECELTGKRMIFERNGRPVAVLVSYDEYFALRETIEIANDAALRKKLENAEDETRRNAMLLVEDLAADVE